MVKKARGVAVRDLGEFYTIDWRINALVQKDIDLEATGRKYGVLREWERLAD
jgi:hypothetical protein